MCISPALRLAFLLGTLFVLASANTINTTDDNNTTCPAAGSTCRKCAVSTSCGYCATDRSCQLGSIGGSYTSSSSSYDVCSGSNWSWFSEDCPPLTTFNVKFGGTLWGHVLAQNRSLVLSRLRWLFAQRFGVSEERVWIFSAVEGSLLVDAEVSADPITGAVISPAVIQNAMLRSSTADLSGLQELYASTTGVTTELIAVQTVSASTSTTTTSATSFQCDTPGCRGMLAGVILAGIFMVLFLLVLLIVYFCKSTAQSQQPQQQQDREHLSKIDPRPYGEESNGASSSSSRQQGLRNYDYTKPAPTKMHTGLTVSQQRERGQQQQQLANNNNNHSGWTSPAAPPKGAEWQQQQQQEERTRLRAVAVERY